MWRSRETRFDVASAISQGKRDYQEDAVMAEFPIGADFGYAILADGMGGHAAGDVASKMILTEVYSEMKFHTSDILKFEANAPTILNGIAFTANECLKSYVAENPDVRGMGATLVVPVIIEDNLFWISIGDSPLYLMRGGKLRQLNEDHSMAPQIDLMVNSGLMDAETGRNHPDRNCLTSVLLGAKVARIDCPKEPFKLLAGDIIIVASDGVQFLSDDKIERIVYRNRKRRSSEIADKLLSTVEALGDPDQDNICFSVVKVNHVAPAAFRRSAASTGLAIAAAEAKAILKEADMEPVEFSQRRDRVTKLVPMEDIDITDQSSFTSEGDASGVDVNGADVVQLSDTDGPGDADGKDAKEDASSDDTDPDAPDDGRGAKGGRSMTAKVFAAGDRRS